MSAFERTLNSISYRIVSYRNGTTYRALKVTSQVATPGAEWVTDGCKFICWPVPYCHYSSSCYSSGSQRSHRSCPLANDVENIDRMHVLSPNSMTWCRSRAAMPCSWEGNRRSVVALAMRHILQWFMLLRAHGLRKGDEQPACIPLRDVTGPD